METRAANGAEIPLKRLLVIFGTRPEAIKMAPVIAALRRDFLVEVCISAQHRHMLDGVLRTFDISANYDLDLMRPRQSLTQITTGVLEGLEPVLDSARPNLVIVHGDTTTTFASALAAFYRNVPVAHVEAGLRTYDNARPYPEELNRQIVGRIARWHFAPTERAAGCLRAERVPAERVFVTGNTVVDALLSVRQRARSARYPDELHPTLERVERRCVLVTAHRRESHGAAMRGICLALLDIVDAVRDVDIVYPVHPNPLVRAAARRHLPAHPRIHLIPPLDYLPFVRLLDRCALALSDSGGMQEEAPALDKPLLVMRELTERPEAVDAGVVRLVGTRRERIAQEAVRMLTDRAAWRAMSRAESPYGDGQAAARIRDALLRRL